MDGARGWFWEAVEPFPSLVQLASCIDSYFNIIYYAESLSLLIIINKAATSSSYKGEPLLSALWNSVKVLAITPKPSPFMPLPNSNICSIVLDSLPTTTCVKCFLFSESL